jgi:hypothetical protein
MPFSIIFFDEPGKQVQRKALRDAHIEYMKANAHRVLASGALLDDSGEVANGGLIILDTDSRADAETFVRDDPFKAGGVYGQTHVLRWRKAFFGGECLLP